MKKHIFTLVACLLVTMFVLTGCAGPAEHNGNSDVPAKDVVEIKYAVVGSDTHQYTIMANEFKKAVEAKSDGKIKVSIFPNAQLGSEREMAEGVRMGTIQMTTVTSDGSLPAWVPELQIFSLPYLFRDRDHVYKALDGEIGKELGDKLLAQGFRSLGFCELGWRHFTNNVRPASKPEDLKGLKIRVQEAKVWFALVEALGATPTPIPFGELYTALQQRTVDGQENPVGSIRSMKFYEVQKYLTLDGHTYAPGSVLINPKFFDSLSPELQQVVEEAAKEAIAAQREIIAKQEEEDLQYLKDNGMEVIEADREAFAEATKDVPETVSDQVPLELVERVRNFK
ncbi:MAG: DctP family TRAP transporter solute-binding subunit [Firmicutes bacterium]|nr:DctP family TRAP transporter solute-binding subunit [Bacillota bacterium]